MLLNKFTDLEKKLFICNIFIIILVLEHTFSSKMSDYNSHKRETKTKICMSLSGSQTALFSAYF